jgi:hypothetical protein
MERQITSDTAWKRINEEGLLSPMRLRVYNALCQFGPATSGELTVHLLKTGPNTGNPSFHKRLAELENQGVAMRTKIRKDTHSGDDAWEWQAVSGALPTTPKKKEKPKNEPPDKDVLAKCLPALRKLYLDLRADGNHESAATAIKKLGLWVATICEPNPTLVDAAPVMPVPEPPKPKNSYVFPRTEVFVPKPA